MAVGGWLRLSKPTPTAIPQSPPPVMPYVSPTSRSSGDVITASIWNQDVVDNSKASAPDSFTTKGDLFAATAADAGARVGVGADDSTLVADSAQTAGLAWQTQPAARVYNSGDIDPATSTWVALTFDSERFDTDTVHSTVTNTGRLTVPTGGTGLYTIGLHVTFDSSGGANNFYGVRIRLNGSTVIAQETFDRTQAQDHSVALTTLYALTAADYVEAEVYTVEDVNVLALGNYSPEFWMNFERRQ